MSKQIENLSDDIYALFRSQPRGTPEEVAEKFGQYGVDVAMLMERAMRERTAERKEEKVLWASEIGKPCHRQVWYAHNTPTLAEPVPEHTKFKFLYGDLLEATVLHLAKLAGHEVTDEQKQHEMLLPRGWKVRGRQDATIDNVVVDVKSASQFGMKKFEMGLTDENDEFGYRHQLSLYNPEDRKQGFVVVDKANGHIKFFEQKRVPITAAATQMTNSIDKAHEPDRITNAEADATYSNKKLGVTCSYCPFKTTCWRKANKGGGLVIAFYSNGPQFLSKVNKLPSCVTKALPAPPDAEDELKKAMEKNS